MGDSKLLYPVAELHGAIEREGAIHRKKKYRDENGKIIGEGKQETYKLVHPRDYKHNPKTPAEIRHQECFRVASNKANALIRALRTPEETSPELLEELAGWKARFQAQLLAKTGSKPDPEAPIDPATGKGKRYVRLDSFIRAIIYYQLRAQNNI